MLYSGNIKIDVFCFRKQNKRFTYCVVLYFLSQSKFQMLNDLFLLLPMLFFVNIFGGMSGTRECNAVVMLENDVSFATKKNSVDTTHNFLSLLNFLKITINLLKI